MIIFLLWVMQNFLRIEKLDNFHFTKVKHFNFHFTKNETHILVKTPKRKWKKILDKEKQFLPVYHLLSDNDFYLEYIHCPYK